VAVATENMFCPKKAKTKCKTKCNDKTNKKQNAMTKPTRNKMQ
jgi:hypothetical protein